MYNYGNKRSSLQILKYLSLCLRREFERHLHHLHGVQSSLLGTEAKAQWHGQKKEWSFHFWNRCFKIYSIAWIYDITETVFFLAILIKSKLIKKEREITIQITKVKNLIKIIDIRIIGSLEIKIIKQVRKTNDLKCYLVRKLSKSELAASLKDLSGWL